jgi:hypothetical protein
MPTRRQSIASVLRRGPVSVHALARIFGVPLKIVSADVEHLRLSLRGEERLEVIPAECFACGYIFDTRKRLDCPSRCPQCKSENLSAPEFFISMPARP